MIKKEWEHTHIELCGICGGAGVVYAYEDYDLLKLRTPKETTCPCCNGTGRVLKSKEIMVQVEPFDTEKAKNHHLINSKYKSSL